MKQRIEVQKNSDGRIQNGTVYQGTRKKLTFQNEWDQDGFLAARTIEALPANMPSTTELLRMIDQEFIEKIRQIDYIDEIKNIARIDSVKVLPSNSYGFFHGYGYRHWNPVSRPTNDVYDVVATPDGLYYVASDRDLYQSPQKKELVTYDRLLGTRKAAIDIGNDCSLDLRDDGKEVVYYNAKSGYVEAATVPDLVVTKLFNPSFTAGSNSVVKYDPTNVKQLFVQEVGNNNLDSKIWTRQGVLVDTISEAATEYAIAGCLEPENWVIACQTSSQPQQHNLKWYRRDTDALVGLIPNRPDTAINMHVRTPFLTVCGDKGPPLVTEFGGVPFNTFRMSSNCLYPILAENSFVGTYYFSIFEVPMTTATPSTVTQSLTRLDFVVGANASFDLSFLRGLNITILSDKAAASLAKRTPMNAAGAYQVGYARVYAEPSPIYATVQTVTPAGTDRVWTFTIDWSVWQNIQFNNGANQANVTVLAAF